MQTMYIILSIVSLAAGLVGTIITAAVNLGKAIKARIKAETEAAKEKANADLLAHAQEFIQGAENSFESFNKLLKSQGSSAGPMKKENVLTKLQAYALQQGYEFDAEAWSATIDQIVAFTREVNAKK